MRHALTVPRCTTMVHPMSPTTHPPTLRAPAAGRAPLAWCAPAFAAVTALFLLLPSGLSAQYNDAPPPAAWGMANVTVHHGDGRVEEGVTVVVRGGVIQTLRAGASLPADARDLSWEEGTLHLYPGFVDVHGSVAPELPTPSRDGVQSWNPTREVQFFTPHREAAAYLTTTGAGLASERRRGVVASVVLPGRGPLPGQPSLILHRGDARTPGEVVLEPSLGLAAAWQGAQGAYPGTLMAQHAFLRQVFLDAAHYRAHREAWSRNPEGRAPVTRDADHEWVLRAAAGEVPVWFQAGSAGDIRRVLDLADELGFRPVLVGGAEAGAFARELARRQIPVLLSAALPQPQAWDPSGVSAEAGEAPTNGEASGRAEGRGAPTRADDLSPAAFRERARLEPIYRTPALLEEAGVPFAFTSGGSSATDFLAGARRAIQFGLSEEAALRALTRTPAELVGVPSLSQVGEGGAATFLVTDRPLFDEGAGVVWTFVNGHAEKGRDPQAPRPVRPEGTDTEPPPADGADEAQLVGSWTGTLDGGPQSLPLSFTFEMRDGRLQGSTTNPMGGGTSPLQDVRVEGDRIRFGLAIPQAQGAVIPLEGVLADDRITGRGDFQFGGTSIPFTFELRRAPGENLR